jgi:hypothetical protein
MVLAATDFANEEWHGLAKARSQEWLWDRAGLKSGSRTRGPRFIVPLHVR